MNNAEKCLYKFPSTSDKVSRLFGDTSIGPEPLFVLAGKLGECSRKFEKYSQLYTSEQAYRNTSGASNDDLDDTARVQMRRTLLSLQNMPMVSNAAVTAFRCVVLLLKEIIGILSSDENEDDRATEALKQLVSWFQTSFVQHLSTTGDEMDEAGAAPEPETRGSQGAITSRKLAKFLICDPTFPKFCNTVRQMTSVFLSDYAVNIEDLDAAHGAAILFSLVGKKTVASTNDGASVVMPHDIAMADARLLLNKSIANMLKYVFLVPPPDPAGILAKAV